MDSSDTTKLAAAVDRLLAEAQEADSCDALKSCAHVVLDLRSGASQEQLEEAVAALSGALDPEYAEVSGWLAVTAGAIVEFPADIGSFDGSRIILLGPPSYARSWGTARFFSALRASVVLEETFSTSETREWLLRLGRAMPHA